MSLRVASPAELPERDVHSLNHQQRPQMTEDGIRVTSASSVISESVRDQILGRSARRRRAKPRSTPINSSTPPNSKRSNTRSFEETPNGYKSALDDSVKPPSKTSKSESLVIGSHTGLSNQQQERSRDSFNHHLVSMTSSKNSFGRTAKVVCQCGGHNKSDTSMKKTDSRPTTQVRTQTVAVQTIAISTNVDCRCPTRVRNSCKCKPHCNCRGCRCGLIDREVNPLENASKSTFGVQTGGSDQSLDTLNSSSPNCRCEYYWSGHYEMQSTSDPCSDNSDDSYTTDFFDLPYQNNEEYLKLLKELEKKLIARNRERVKKTMLEFEKRSRQNQNLERPIFDDYGDDSACLLRKLGSGSPRGRHVCCKCGKTKKSKKLKKVNSDILQNEKRWDQMNIVQSVVQTSEPNANQNTSRMERSLRKSHWQLDPRSGEWIKVSCYQQTDYARHPSPPQGDYLKEDHKKFIPPLNIRKRECTCQRKRR